MVAPSEVTINQSKVLILFVGAKETFLLCFQKVSAILANLYFKA